MRKLIFSPLVFLALNAFGQASAPAKSNLQMSSPGMFEPEFIVAVQMGTDTLKDGKLTVKLADGTIDEMQQAKAQPNYVVMLTPRGECGQVNLVETTDKDFKVKEQKGSGDSKGIFDYVVYVKQRRPMMPMRPHPSMSSLQQKPPTPAK